MITTSCGIIFFKFLTRKTFPKTCLMLQITPPPPLSEQNPLTHTNYIFWRSLILGTLRDPKICLRQIWTSRRTLPSMKLIHVCKRSSVRTSIAVTHAGITPRENHHAHQRYLRYLPSPISQMMKIKTWKATLETLRVSSQRNHLLIPFYFTQLEDNLGPKKLVKLAQSV